MQEKVIESPGGIFVIRTYRDGDEEGVLRLWHAAFGKEMSRRVWQWKYAQNPFGRQIMLCVSEAGQPVAMYSGIPYRAAWKGRVVRFTHLMDNMSHPEFRGAIGGRRGLFVRTAEELFNRYGGPHASVFFYGFPGRRHFLLGKRVLQYSAFVNEAGYLSVPLSKLKRKMMPFRGAVALRKTVDESLDDLSRTYAPIYPFAVLRNREFLQWRFFRHPERKYLFYTYETWWKHRVKGYAVFSVQESTAALVDLFLSAATKDIEDFMGKLAPLLERQGVEKIETWMPRGHFLWHGLLSLGWGHSAEPLGIVPGGRTFDPSLSFDWVSKNIFYTMADADVV